MVQVKGGGQDFRGVVVQASEHFGVGFGHSFWGVQETAAGRVLADGHQDFPHGRLDPGLVDLTVLSRVRGIIRPGPGNSGSASSK